MDSDSDGEARVATRRRLAVMGGVSLHVDDVSCLLEEGEWLNDKVIHFYLEYLRYAKFTEDFEDIEILAPAVVLCLKASRSSEVLHNMVSPLRLSRKKVVVLPINNASTTDDSGGTHWSIIVLTPADGKFHHFDSLDVNREYAKEVANKLQHCLCFERPRFLHFKGIPQDNSSDCGLYVLLNAEKSIGHFLRDQEGTNFEPAGKEDVKDMRKRLLAVIKDISEEQQRSDEEDDEDDIII